MTLKVRITPKLITQPLRMLNLKVRCLYADFGIQLRDQGFHPLARAGNQLQGVVPRLCEVADG